jgi:hypothetical protein
MNKKIVLFLTLNFLPLYLAAILFLFIAFSIQSLIFILLPLGVIALSMYYHKKDVALFGFSIYSIVSLSQIVISSLEQITLIFSYIILIVLPSLLLLIQILNQTTLPQTIKDTTAHVKPFIISVSLTLCLILTIYLIPIFLGEGILFNIESVQQQIIIIIAASLLISTPFLLKKSKAELKTDL